MPSNDRPSNASPPVVDHTAARVALWRALHVLSDAPPHVLADEVGLRLLAPEAAWRQRGDMHPEGTRGYRAAIVGRTRFIEDLVAEQAVHGVDQYVILGAGLDTFAQRRPELASRLTVFEIDRPDQQAWKRRRLVELGFGVPEWLRFVPVDFEAGQSWRQQLEAAGFDTGRPAVLASTGVSMYLTREANLETLRQVAALAPGSTLVMSFLLPLEQVAPEEQTAYERAQQAARAAGTPFLSLFTPPDMLALAGEAGLRGIRHVSRDDLVRRYFADRPDGLLPATGEEFLVAGP